MVAGRVRCCGTIGFLKRRFGGGDAGGGDAGGGGLHVAVTMAASSRDELKAIFNQHVPEAKLAAASRLADDLVEARGEINHLHSTRCPGTSSTREAPHNTGGGRAPAPRSDAEAVLVLA